MIRRKRLQRNRRDCFDLEKPYELDRYGTNTLQRFATLTTLPNNELLCQSGEEQTLLKLVNRESVRKSDFVKSQSIFTPQVALWLIFMSEDDILKTYLRCWKKYRHVPLNISSELITPNLRPMCSCSDCFGECVRISGKNRLLPEDINHEQMLLELNS
jgi:hypothetical protein